MRGFTRELYDRLDLRCTGMEYATEMIIKASFAGARTAEIPITLHPDGRRSHPGHLRTVRDGWRTLRLFLLYSPTWLFLVPGGLLAGAGLVGYALAMPGTVIGGARLDAHTLMVASLAVICGYQSALFAVFTKTFAVAEGLLPDRRPDAAVPLHASTSSGGWWAGSSRSSSASLLIALRGLRLERHRLRAPRLRLHDALGDPRRDPGRDRLPDRARQLLPERARHAAS